MLYYITLNQLRLILRSRFDTSVQMPDMSLHRSRNEDLH